MIWRVAIAALTAAIPVVGRWPGPFYCVAAAVAGLAWHLHPRLRRRMLTNHTIAADGDRRKARQTARAALANVVRYYVDLASIGHRDPLALERDRIQIEGSERLRVLESGRPIVVLSAHLGSPELAVQAITGRAKRFLALVEPVRPPAYARLLGKLREGTGGTYRETGPAGTRAALRELRDGGIVALVGDRDIQGHGECVQFFGRCLRLPSGPFELARRGGAIVVPVVSARDHADRLTLFVEEPFEVGGADGDQAARIATERWAALLERHIRRDPGQWTVTEDFFGAHRCG